MSDQFVDVDPANGTEEVKESGAGMVAGEIPSPPAPTPVHETPAPDSFTAPEKIASVVQAVLASPGTDPKMRGLLAALTSGLGRRLLIAPMLEMLPSMDEPEEWDAWLEVLVGIALELTSDGVDLDTAEARGKARFILSALFEAAG